MVLGLLFLAGSGVRAVEEVAPVSTKQAEKQTAVENLFFNASFELGMEGFASIKYLRFETNPEAVFEKQLIDDTTCVSGRRSLRVPNRFAEETLVYAGEVKVDLAREYAFSIWMKSDVDKLPVIIWLCNSKWSGGIRTFDVGRDWKPYTFTFTTKDDRECDYYHMALRFGQGADAVPATLWLDDVQITPDTATTFAPAAPVEVCVLTEKLYHPENGRAEVQLESRLLNNTEQPVDVELTLAVFDDYRNREIAAPNVRVSLPPHEMQVRVLPVTVDKLGIYRIESRLSGATAFKTLPDYFAVVGKYEVKPLDLDRDFCVGVNEGCGFISDTRIKRGWQTLGGLSRDDYVDLLANMGCRLIRDWWSMALSWQQLELTEGEFDFRAADAAVETYSRHGLYIMPVLANGFSFKPESSAPGNGSWPEWVRERSKTAEIWLDCNHGRPLKKSTAMLVLPPVDLFRKYIRAVGERYRGRISHYEITNEPNLYISPQDYMTYLKPAAEELHAADPSCKVVGFCSTGDLAGAGKSAAYLEPCFEAGGLKDADIVSFHPYDSRQLSSARAADKMIETYRSLIRKHGGSNPLWNTELFFLSDGKSDEFDPPCAAKRFLIDLGEGVRQSNCIHATRLFRPRLLEHSFRSPNRHYVESLPSPVYVMYNALARLFESARPVEKLRWPVDCICYVYERDGHSLAAFWKYGDMENLRLCLPFTHREAVLYDLFGNEIPFADRPVALNDEPYYLQLKDDAKLDRAEFLKRLRTPRIDSETAATLQFRRLLPTADGLLALVDVFNCTPDALNGQVNAGMSGATGTPVDFQLPAYETETVRVPLKTTGGALRYKVTAAVTTGAQSFEKEFDTPPVYTAKKGYGPVEELKKIGRGWNIKPQVSGTFQAGYDAENFLLRVVVKDGTPAGETPEHPRRSWQQDSVEFFIDTRPEQLSGELKDAKRYNPRVGKFGVLPHAAAARRVEIGATPADLPLFTPEHIKANVELTDDGYTVEAAIPWKVLDIQPPFSGKLIGLDIGVNDAVGEENAASQITWSSWGSHWKDRLSLGLIRLEE